MVVTGAALPDGRQILVALATDLPGVERPPSPQLVGLSASHTGQVLCHDVEVDRQWLLAGPAENVMKSGTGGSTGGLQTSGLAIGHASAAIDYLKGESRQRGDLEAAATEFRKEHGCSRRICWGSHSARLSAMQSNCGCVPTAWRCARSQAALAAAKGTGYVAGHPAGRWCREALFFLVWSCPQPVLAANLCELAGLD